jgi:pentatricopeptide repeat protein
LIIALVVLTYFAGFVRAKRPLPCAAAAKHIRKATPCPGARKVAGGAAKQDDAKVATPTRRQGQWEQWEVDRRLIKAIRKDSLPSDPSAFSTLVGACARLHDAEVALDLFDHMLKTGVVFDQQSLSPYTSSKFFKIVAHNLDGNRLQTDGIPLVRALLAHGLEPSTLIQNQVIRAWRSKLPEHVVEMFANLRETGVHLSATAYRCVMAANERTDPVFTLRLYDEMVERGVKIDRVAFNAVLCACSHLGMTDKALELFEQMSAHGLIPNGKSYGALIKACASGNREEEALNFFESMRAAGFEPNEHAFRDAIQCCVNLGKLEKAYELYMSMVSIMPRGTPCSRTCKYILEACQKTGCQWIADRIQADAIWTRTGDGMLVEDGSACAHVIDTDTVSE